MELDETSTSLGKRKARDEEGATVEPKTYGSTVFVSNLPYSATSTDLKTLFSDIGPVRSAFVVLDQGTGISKGVGYVSFAIREDAQLAHNNANGNGEPILLDGRKLRVQWADSKHHKDKNEKDSDEVKKEPKPKPIRAPKPIQPSGPKDPLAIRTIVVSGLPASIDSKTLWKKVRKYNGAEKADWPIEKDGIEDKSTAQVLFSNPAAAQEAVSKLHAHVFKGALLSVTLKKRLDGLAKPAFVKPSKASKISSTSEVDPSPSATTSKSRTGPAPSRASRLIVRNLPFDITEQDLRSVFLPYGPIHSIHIPLEKSDKEDKPEEKSGPRRKGYAFVWMLSKKDAELALEGANGAKVRSGMAETLVRDKQKKKKLIREERKMKERERARKAKAKEGEGGGDVEDRDEEEQEEDVDVDVDEKEEEDVKETSELSSERVIAVDWALSKDKWEEAKAKMQDEVEEEVEVSGSEASSDEDSHIGVHQDGSDSEDSDSDEDSMDVDEDDDEEPVKPELPAVDVGTTLFVRNVPFEATEDELRTTFRAFGPLRYARITIDHNTGRSRGTGFVCFWNREDADKAIEQSDILRQETMGNDASGPKKNPFKLPSLLTFDPSASIAQNLVLQGRTLDVIRAVTRDEAGKLKEVGERQREKADKRNLYLLREGIILPNMPAASSLSQTELENRSQSYNSRRALLRSNPSLYVSRTRLSVRQLPLTVSERMLKRLGIHAVRAFRNEVKAGSREGLTEDELTERVEDDAEEDTSKATDAKDKGKGKGKGRNTGVKQAKIVRQQDRVDPVTGKGRSRGYGFLEMEKHADALRVLRWANNSPEVGKLFADWWKEELEDLVKAEKKKEKKDRDDARLERLKKELEGLKDGEGGSRGKGKKGALIVEFSIENVQVVKRRAAHEQEQKTGPSEPRKSRKPSSSVKKEKKEDEDKSTLPARKKRRVSEPHSQKPGEAKPDASSSSKMGSQIGSLIGRKRKERKGKSRS